MKFEQTKKYNQSKFPFGQDYFLSNSLLGIECMLTSKKNKR